MKVKAVRGMQDILPRDAVRWRHAEAVARRAALQYGYGEIRTPVLEEARLFSHSVGELTDIVQKEMYSFQDAKGRTLALRPEGTAPVVRSFIEHGLGQAMPVCKLFYIGSFFRHERPQAGRRRQFAQFGVEALGSPDPAVDAEVISLGSDLAGRLGLEDLAIKMNSVGCSGCQPAYRAVLEKYLSERIGSLCEDCGRRAEKNPLRVLDCKRPECRRALEGAPASTDSLCSGCREHFDTVGRMLDSFEIPWQLDPRQVRGLDYYTRTTFEVTTGALGAQDAVLAGGRYDGLVASLGGDSVPAVGFAAGIDRMLLVLEQQGRKLPADVPALTCMVGLGQGHMQELAGLANRLRRRGLAVDICYEGGGLKKQLRGANRRGAARVLIRGDDEAAQGVVVRKDMETGEQEEVPWDGAEAVLVERYCGGGGGD